MKRELSIKYIKHLEERIEKLEEHVAITNKIRRQRNKMAMLYRKQREKNK